MKNGNPFITVQCAAGGSYPSLGDEGYQAYVSDTDKGTLEISVAEGYFKWASFCNRSILGQGNKIKWMFEKTKGTLDAPLFQNNTVMSVDPNLNFKVNKVYTIQVI